MVFLEKYQIVFLSLFYAIGLVCAAKNLKRKKLVLAILCLTATVAAYISGEWYILNNWRDVYNLKQVESVEISPSADGGSTLITLSPEVLNYLGPETTLHNIRLNSETDIRRENFERQYAVTLFRLSGMQHEGYLVSYENPSAAALFAISSEGWGDTGWPFYFYQINGKYYALEYHYRFYTITPKLALVIQEAISGLEVSK